MSDELHAERIERLTQLAREVWPDRDEQMVIHEITGAAMIAYRSRFPCSTVDGSEGERIVSYHTRIDHPRALDALEAALLALVGDNTRAQLARLEERVRDVLQTELARRDGALPAWVEQLAREWEKLADGVHARRGDGVITDYENALRENAEELRERAKGTP